LQDILTFKKYENKKYEKMKYKIQIEFLLPLAEVSALLVM